MFVIVGLGNPGKKYENTRHNAGYMAIDAIAAKYGISVKEKKRHEIFHSRQFVVVLLSHSFMGNHPCIPLIIPKEYRKKSIEVEYDFFPYFCFFSFCLMLFVFLLLIFQISIFQILLFE